MLVLSRKINESILIGDNVKITVTSIQGDKVKIGIEAPKDVSLFREEVYIRHIKEFQNGHTQTPQCGTSIHPE